MVNNRTQERVAEKDRKYEKIVVENGVTEKILLGKVLGRQEIVIEDAAADREYNRKQFELLRSGANDRWIGCGKRFANRMEVGAVAVVAGVALVVALKLLTPIPEHVPAVIETLLPKVP